VKIVVTIVVKRAVKIVVKHRHAAARESAHDDLHDLRALHGDLHDDVDGTANAAPERG
jgi:hypothetical protein